MCRYYMPNAKITNSFSFEYENDSSDIVMVNNTPNKTNNKIIAFFRSNKASVFTNCKLVGNSDNTGISLVWFQNPIHNNEYIEKGIEITFSSINTHSFSCGNFSYVEYVSLDIFNNMLDFIVTQLDMINFDYKNIGSTYYNCDVNKCIKLYSAKHLYFIDTGYEVRGGKKRD